MTAICCILLACLVGCCSGANILMATLGGTKSHKIPFLALGNALQQRGHKVTLVSAFPGPPSALEEITPAGLVFYVKNFTDWDLLGARLRGEDPVSVWDTLRYGFQVCDAFLGDPETRALVQTGARQPFDLLVLDGAFPECAVGLAHKWGGVPFVFINTVAFYTLSLAHAGNPTPYALTPFLSKPFTDDMTLPQRALNAGLHVGIKVLHMVCVKVFLEGVVRRHLGSSVPPLYSLTKNVSFILQNGHATITYPRAYLPTVAEVGCLHCRPPQPLPKELDDFIGEAGFVYVSMGSSVKASNMPEYLRVLLVTALGQLPYKVLWKWEDPSSMGDLPSNIKLSTWLPQQDLLGDRRLRAVVSHGGLLTLLEAVFHGVPVVALPVFCDQDANAAKAAADGYALRLDWQTLTGDGLLRAIHAIAHNPKYRENARQRSMLLRDQPLSPLDTAVFWTEYVLRHRGTAHLQSPAKDLGFFQYFMLDVLFLLVLASAVLTSVFRHLRRLLTPKKKLD